MSEPCIRCGKPSDPRAELVLAAKVDAFVARKWGGPSPANVSICIDCMWRLENAAGDAIASEISRLKAPMTAPTSLAEVVARLAEQYEATAPIRDLYIEVGGELAWVRDPQKGFLPFWDKGGIPELGEADPYWPHEYSQEMYNWIAAFHNAWPQILGALRIATEYAETLEWGRDLTRVEMARRRERFIEAFSGITLATFASASAGKEEHDD